MKGIYEQTIERQVYTDSPPEAMEYENCIFKQCDFSRSDLSGKKFFECEFTDCNLSMAVLHNATIRDCRFKDCKMLGMLFEKCSDFALSFSFDNCILTHSSFYGRKCRNTIFRKCQLHECDFSGSDLSGSSFAECDLLNARFEQSVLDKCDFRGAFNYRIDPELNRMKKARFSLEEVPGLLSRYDIVIER